MFLSRPCVPGLSELLTPVAVDKRKLCSLVYDPVSPRLKEEPQYEQVEKEVALEEFRKVRILSIQAKSTRLCFSSK